MDQAVCCYQHPDRETGVRCARCSRAICPQCMVSASVGFHCPACVTDHHQQARTVTRPRTVAGGAVASNPRLVTMVLIAINFAVFLAVHAYGNRLVYDLDLNDSIAFGQWYRLLTSVFLHQELAHIALNMLSLWWIGPSVEAAFGRARYLAIYLLSGLGGSALSFLLLPPDTYGLGASGAIFGLLGALFVVMRRLRYDLRPLVVIIALNLLFTFSVPNIDWRAHIGGLVTGVVIASAMVHAPRERRAAVQWGTCAVMLGVVVAVVALGTVRLVG